VSDIDLQITHLLKVAKDLYKNASADEVATVTASTVDEEMKLHQKWEDELEAFLKDAKELGLSDSLVQDLRKEALEAHEKAMSKSAAVDNSDLVELGQVLDRAERMLLAADSSQFSWVDGLF
jgi:uncharacterized protein (UPF0264 family)